MRDLSEARARIIREALQNGPSGGRMTAGQRKALEAANDNAEPCLCATDFTCMADHEDEGRASEAAS